MNFEITTLESAYFHTGNSGVTVSIDATETLSAAGDNVDCTYRLKVQHGAHGSHTEVNVPLGSLHMVQYMIEALSRVEVHMKEHKFIGEFAFVYGMESAPDDYVMVMNGANYEKESQSNIRTT